MKIAIEIVNKGTCGASNLFYIWHHKYILSFFHMYRLHHIDEQPSGGAAQEEVDFSKAFQVDSVI